MNCIIHITPFMIAKILDPQIRKDGRDGKDRKDGDFTCGIEVRTKARMS